MKYFFPVLVLSILLLSCSKKNKPVVEATFIDSVLANYYTSESQRINAADLLFWKKRMDSMPGGYVNEEKYAGTLINRFLLYGHISDLKTADSIMQFLVTISKEKEAGFLRTLASLAILQHRFKEADTYVKKAINIGSEKYASLLLQYDIAFELGLYNLAENTLESLQSSNEYGYFFRLARQFHFRGEHDSSIMAMQKAFELAGSSKYLQQTTLSNKGDLALHASNIENAYNSYKQSLQIDLADLHSLSGIGWIALIHDHNEKLAEKIFRFIQSKTTSPDPLLKMAFISEQKMDSIAAKKYAASFAIQASDSLYGNMYNKYLIDFYTGILNEPAQAKAIAEKELTIRNTPQTYSWYAWSLYKNNETDSALQIYKRYVSGKSLEGPELYYMGMMMKGMNKRYNAKQFLNAANKNRYDLSPAKIKELEAD